MGGPPPAITSNQNTFLWPVAACWAPGASVEVFLRLGGHFGVPRCVASGPTTENMPLKTFFKNSTRKNVRVTRWRGRVPRGREPPSASRNATYSVLSGFETETDESIHGIKYVYRTSIVFKEAPARPRRRLPPHNHHHRRAAAASRVNASLMPTTRFNFFEKNIYLLPAITTTTTTTAAAAATANITTTTTTTTTTITQRGALAVVLQTRSRLAWIYAFRIRRALLFTAASLLHFARLRSRRRNQPKQNKAARCALRAVRHTHA